jgi:hypothetical protein
MHELRVLTAAEQVGNHLRAELFRGAWGGLMPGGSRLATELGVGRDTVEAALLILEKERLLVPQGAGRRRRIELPEGKVVNPLRVAILDYEPPEVVLALGYMTDLVHRLRAAGHSVFFAEKCLLELGMDVGRVAPLVRRTEADAWVVGAGSREVLEWFAAQPMPVFAIFGRRHGLPIAGVGPDKESSMAAATGRLIGLGHRKISLLCRRQRRLPQPGLSERAFLNELAAHGVPTGAFNLPDWEETRKGFGALMDSLFAATPPTALILDEPFLFNAAFHYLAKRKLRVPQDVSLVCTDDDPMFAWCEPSVAHIRWDSRPVLRRVVRWVDNVSRGKEDRRQTPTKAEFVEGGTIGPVKGR